MRALPVGDRALLVEVSTDEEAQALHADLLRRRAEGSLSVREIVPAARTVLLDGLDDPAGLAARLTTSKLPPAPARAQEAVEIPVRYDGPDLAAVAGHWDVSPKEVARIHAAAEFRVAFCGFAPGFGYLTGLPARYGVPRHATPRTTVPAGSVGLAGPVHGRVSALVAGRLATDRDDGRRPVGPRARARRPVVAGHAGPIRPGGA